jgi:hypothetical protein
MTVLPAEILSTQSDVFHMGVETLGNGVLLSKCRDDQVRDDPLKLLELIPGLVVMMDFKVREQGRPQHGFVSGVFHSAPH